MLRLSAVLTLCLTLLMLGMAPAMAAGGSDPTPAAKPVDPNFTEGKKAIDAKDWAKAIPLFEQVVAKDAQNADAFNWLGYAFRNQGNYDQSFAHYTKALAIQPGHRGAHEYIGEAYLKVNNLQKAEEHLKRLDSICTFGCAEYTELKGKIAAYKAAKPS
ncbi:tetratricopeptide repeat protein [Ferrovibrio terrae]|jgi:tetratricopeptide (TPR) repeat protein|uniref:tetratricopeptide repeat protein n=1 Tax=Ferrovibrio terrae TaxID=2594003 RepID=UPI00313779D5